MSISEPAHLEQPVEEGGAAQEPAPSSLSLYRSLGLLGAILGLVLALAACGCGPLTLLSAILFEQDTPMGPAIQQALALMALGLGMGAILATVGWRAWQGKASRPFHPRRTWPLWAVFLLLLTAGLAISLLDLASDYALPPINTAMMLLLPMLILAPAGRLLGGAGGTRRGVAGGLLSGASLGTGLALFIEMVLLVTFAAGAVLLGLIPAELYDLESLQELENQALSADSEMLLNLITPGVLLLVLAFVAIATPLVEEVTKTLGMGLAGVWVRPTPAQAFLLGVASGAGFALAENLLNGAIIDTELWGLLVFGRLAATLMHCATGGLVGWGWGEMWTAHKPGRLALAFALSVGVHSLWNGLAVGAAVVGLAAIGQSDGTAWTSVILLAVVAMAVAMLLLAATMMAGVVWASRALRRQEGGT